MNSTFTYSLTLEDYINYEKIKFRQKRSAGITYISCLILLAVGTFNIVVNRDFIILYITAGYIVLSVAAVLYEGRLRPQKFARKYTSLDSTYFAPRQVVLTPQSIEFTVNGENGVYSTGVYPLKAIGAVFESNDYFQIFLTTEYYIIPKSAIPAQDTAMVENILRARPNYVKIKNI